MERAPEPDLADLLRRGDPSAPTLLVGRYAARLIALARSRLGERLRAKLDPEDVVQSVFRSFFRRHAEADWDLDDPNGLWALLVQFTLRKCNRRLGYYLASRRDVRREAAPGAAGEQVSLAGEPTPDEAAALADLAESVMRRLGTDTKRRVFELTLQGYGVTEISDRVGYYERGVERARAEIRALLLSLLADDPPGAVPQAAG